MNGVAVGQEVVSKCAAKDAVGCGGALLKVPSAIAPAQPQPSAQPQAQPQAQPEAAAGQ